MHSMDRYETTCSAHYDSSENPKPDTLGKTHDHSIVCDSPVEGLARIRRTWRPTVGAAARKCPPRAVREDSGYRGRVAEERKRARLTEGLEAIADAEDGLDVAISVGAELLAQAADMHVQGAGADLFAVAPNSQEKQTLEEGSPLRFAPLRRSTRALCGST